MQEATTHPHAHAQAEVTRVFCGCGGVRLNNMASNFRMQAVDAIFFAPHLTESLLGPDLVVVPCQFSFLEV